uniref:Pnuts protein n=1 Tax=Papilio xuthus TaxID=66420 RepID=I4DK77_PAPXU|nr:pnuts protein [Papilio xuthus]
MPKDNEKESETLPVLKITLKNGKQIISQVDEDSVASDDVSDKDKIREKHRSKSKEKSSDRSSSSSRSSSKHSSKSSSDKYKSSHKSSSSKHSSSKERSKDKEKHSSHSSKSKHNTSSGSSSSGRKTSSSSRSKDDKTKHSTEKEKTKEKDDKGKASPNPSAEKSDDKSSTPSIHKLGKIPKLSDVKKDKPSISIEVRKPDEPKPKTVKTFNSKFRKHGLEEEVKPPPSRAALLNKKPPPPLPPSIPIPKRPSPVHNETPPEKKIKTIDMVEKPGAIKLIPPKPKREYILNYLFYNILVTCFIFTGKEGPLWPMSSRKFVYLGCKQW